jgi:hypothetical protein
VALLAALPCLGQQCGARRVLKHLPHAVVGLGAALEVFGRIDLLADFFAL